MSVLSNGLCRKKAGGFTMVELLIVIAIILVLAALMFPQLQGVRDRANSVKCAANLRQIGTGFHLYANENNGEFPALNAGSGDTNTWMTRVAPYLGIPDGKLGPAPLARAVPPFICPSWKMDATRKVSYAVNENIRRAPFNWNYKRLNVSAGKTFLVVEIAENMDGYNPATGGDVARRHPGKSANFLFVDGHVENMKQAIPSGDPRWFTP